MSAWKWLWIIGMVAVVIFGYQRIKRNPEAFKGENIHKSFHTMGLLALLLIGGIALMVFLLQ